MLRRVLLAAAFGFVFVSAASAASVKYHAYLTGAHEVPKTDSKGKGTFNATFDTQTKALDYTLRFQGLTGPATAAHIHGPAAIGQNAGVVAPLGDKNPTSPVTGSVTLTEDQAKELAAGKFYVNVHTDANKGGEIRGQIHTVKARAHRKTAAPAAAPAAAAPAVTAPAAQPK